MPLDIADVISRGGTEYKDFVIARAKRGFNQRAATG